MKYAEAVKERVDALLEVTGLKATDLIAAMGISSSTYYDMWRNGYITCNACALLRCACVTSTWRAPKASNGTKWKC